MQFDCVFFHIGRKFECLISQGNVATCLRWGGQCCMSLVANFGRFPAAQKFWTSVKIWQSYRQLKGGNFFETQCAGRPAVYTAGPWIDAFAWRVYICTCGSLSRSPPFPLPLLPRPLQCVSLPISARYCPCSILPVLLNVFYLHVDISLHPTRLDKMLPVQTRLPVNIAIRMDTELKTVGEDRLVTDQWEVTLFVSSVQNKVTGNFLVQIQMRKVHRKQLQCKW